MQSALQRLVDACPGDDHPHCAILEGLADGRSDAPAVRPAGTGARSAARARAKRPAPAAAKASAAAHLDLMAWTRAVHEGPRSERGGP
jgi:hypothetical protein